MFDGPSLTECPILVSCRVLLSVSGKNSLLTRELTSAVGAAFLKLSTRGCGFSKPVTIFSPVKPFWVEPEGDFNLGNRVSRVSCDGRYTGFSFTLQRTLSSPSLGGVAWEGESTPADSVRGSKRRERTNGLGSEGSDLFDKIGRLDSPCEGFGTPVGVVTVSVFFERIPLATSGVSRFATVSVSGVGPWTTRSREKRSWFPFASSSTVSFSTETTGYGPSTMGDSLFGFSFSGL